jgi:hypothetical protein
MFPLFFVKLQGLVLDREAQRHLIFTLGYLAKIQGLIRLLSDRQIAVVSQVQSVHCWLLQLGTLPVVFKFGRVVRNDDTLMV